MGGRFKEASTGDGNASPLPNPPPASRGEGNQGASAGRPTFSTDPPSFWLDFSVSREKLSLLRLVFFGVLALDAFLQIPHAPRYGTGFNVAHFGFLDDLAPGRNAMAFCKLVECMLLAAVALGLGRRPALIVAAALNAWVYFSSQLDSYQHHYLVAMVLGLTCFVPWWSSDGEARTWALRLILVVCGIVYFWAAVAKLSGRWLDGTALESQLGTAWMRAAIEALPGGWATAAAAILALELFLAVAIWCRPLWPVAWPLAVGFHVGVELSGLEVGLFSYLMMALYVALIPERALATLARPVAHAVHLGLAGLRRIPQVLLVALSAVPMVLAGVWVPFDWNLGALLVVAIVLVAPALGERAVARGLVAIGLAASLVLVLSTVTEVWVDFYRLWGGSARRLGRGGDAVVAYQKVIELDDKNSNAYYQLGKLAYDSGGEAEALDRFRRAQALEPARARAHLAIARVLLRRGDRDGALAAARDGAAAEPGSVEAAKLIRSLESGAAPTPGGADD